MAVRYSEKKKCLYCRTDKEEALTRVIEIDPPLPLTTRVLYSGYGEEFGTTDVENGSNEPKANLQPQYSGLCEACHNRGFHRVTIKYAGYCHNIVAVYDDHPYPHSPMTYCYFCLENRTENLEYSMEIEILKEGKGSGENEVKEYEPPKRAVMCKDCFKREYYIRPLVSETQNRIRVWPASLDD